jgi:acyl-coenzyme A synthetase/AMP-(fatty) acid ligase
MAVIYVMQQKCFLVRLDDWLIYRPALIRIFIRRLCCAKRLAIAAGIFRRFNRCSADLLRCRACSRWLAVRRRFKHCHVCVLFSRVVVSAPSYAEHAYQWRQAGHAVSETRYQDLHDAVANADVVVLCNPNNPTGEVIAPAQLLQWAEQLAQRGGWLIVDEAFADTLPDISVAAHTV